MKKIFLILSFLFCLALGSLLMKNTAKTQADQMKRQLTKEIEEKLRQEFDQQIRMAVKQEVRKEVEAQLAQINLPVIGDNDPLAFNSLKENYQSAIHSYIREAVSREISSKKISDAQLEDYVAGGDLEPELSISQGITKRPQETRILLAANDDQSSSVSNHDHAAHAEEGELTVTGGKERAESLERTLVQRGGLLLPRGQLQFEPSFSFANFSSNRITIQGFSILPVLVIGQISTETVKRNIFIATAAFKYGLWHNLQAELSAPYRWQHDRVTANSVDLQSVSSETTRQFGGVGDITFGLSRQIGWEHGLIPDLIASISVKPPTGRSPYNNSIGIGTGHWSVRSALIAAKSSDPAVVFGSIYHTWNIKKDIDNFGEIDPGDSLGYSLGTAIALSYQTAINFSFDHSVTFKLKKDKRVVPGSFINVANFKTGFTWSLNERSSIDFSVGVGLTTDAPDVTAEIRLPYRF